ncbi:TIGR02679 family protein [Spongiactinospora sp. TRM90649]|uniref:TIGR02679 family protein n=1 Tax=Spongiactinospora sp. TRM90649 TaxID=3031114 RepID=UPI0023F83CF8|nr:TIGR02679 family protein [Spongiactinospora sp. TRM90649]MDF5752433.1 TIGR02679 family protein [Spongiactinospora sp. TRM90649]
MEPLAFLAQPAFARMWTAVRHRLEREGLAVRGRVRLADPAPEEREAIGLLLGPVRHRGDLWVSLPDLDARLRVSAAGAGLLDVVPLLGGGPLVDRPGLRAAKASAREQAWAEVEAALAPSGLGEWAGEWIAEVRRAGVVARLTPENAVRLLHQAVAVLAELELAQDARRGRAELAARYTGTAHGLDDDTPLSRVVLRGLAARAGRAVPTGAAERRALWAEAGVAVDAVSQTVLTYGLRPTGRDLRSRQLAERSRACAETHLTARDLRVQPIALPPGTLVRICENPRVVEAAADAACAAPLVCVNGNPATVVFTLLDALAATGALFAYHGDFDWPGIAIAARVLARYQAVPWRFRARDYEDAVAEVRERDAPERALSGPAAPTPWDPALATAMEAAGVAVHEESVLATLLADLAEGEREGLGRADVHGR